MKCSDLGVKVYADGADLDVIRRLTEVDIVSGFTTNPTLMRQAGVTDYERFARAALEIVGDRPISFEVFADDHDEIVGQARKVASWGSNVFVKIPITTTDGTSTAPLIGELAASGVRQNVTAMMTLEQVATAQGVLDGGPPALVSIFAGRVADTGRDPIPLMADAVSLLEQSPQIELIWASAREVLNLVHAASVGCPIITLTNDLLSKLEHFDRNLEDFSLATVRMFHDDARASGFRL